MNEAMRESREDTPAGADAPRQSPGAMLREARHTHDYTVEDLCAQTHLKPKTVRALENDDFDALEQPAMFARGYYRQCAKVLDIDRDRLMAAYAAVAGEPGTARPAAATPLGMITEDDTPRGRRKLGFAALLLLAFAVAVIAAAVFLAPGGRSPGQGANGGTTTVPLSANPSDNAGGAAGSKAAAGKPPGQSAGPRRPGDANITRGDTPTIVGNAPPSGQPPADNTVSGPRPGGRNVSRALGNPGLSRAGSGSGGAQGQAAASKPQIPPNRLKLDFNKRSWASVHDGNGNRLLSGTYEAGTSREFNAEPPYKIALGRAAAVDVTMGGHQVDVGSRTAGNGTAHLTVRARRRSG